MAPKLGDTLYAHGYRGVFCVDFLVETGTGEVYLGEINPRISGASPLTNLLTSKYGGCRCSCSTCSSSWTWSGTST